MECILDFTKVDIIVGFSLALAIALACILVILFFSKRVIPALLTAACFGVILFAYSFNLVIVEIIASITLIFILTLYCVTNSVAAKRIFQNAPRKIKNKSDKNIRKLVDTADLYSVIADTVSTLSSTKTGAIITFQRKDDLKPLIRNGVNLGNVPVTKELLLTIFYPGTRLHDGAVIIKDNFIISASVYYALSTRPISGKMGSRHRAAIGISEQSDSVTVVVSEETGRISIAEDGDITHVNANEFLNLFAQIMNQE